MIKSEPLLSSAIGPRGTPCLPLQAFDLPPNLSFQSPVAVQRKRQNEYARFAPTSLASQLADQCVQRKKQFEHARFAPKPMASQLARDVGLAVQVPSHKAGRRVGLGKFVVAGIPCRCITTQRGAAKMSKGSVATQRSSLRSRLFLPSNRVAKGV